MQMYGDFAEKFLFSAFFSPQKKTVAETTQINFWVYFRAKNGAVDLWVWQGMRMDLVWPNIWCPLDSGKLT